MPIEFSEIAKRIALVASEEGGISIAGLPEVLNDVTGTEINLYPSNLEGTCHSLAVFCSLNGKLGKGSGHLKFNKMLEKFLQHRVIIESSV